MKVKFVVEEDFSNYKQPSMFIGLPKCSFKCEKECGEMCCQNSPLVSSPDVDVNVPQLVDNYLQNDITKAIVIGGLEPFDTWQDLLYIVKEFRLKTTDNIIIYTGYNKDEINDYLLYLSKYKNIIVKFGRYIPHQASHLDPILGIELASDNQYAEMIN